MAEEDYGIENQLEAGSRPGSGLVRRIVVSIGVLAVVGGISYGAYSFFFSGTSDAPQDSEKQSALQQEKAQEEELKRLRKIKYVQLFSGLESEDVSNIAKELSLANIYFKTEQSGSKYALLVDENQEVKARNLLAVKNLPSGGVSGYELLDNAQTLGVTEFDKRVRFLRALSGELEKAILKFDMIEDAKVQIVLPENKIFAVSQPPVTASVLIRRKPGKKITDSIVFSIIQLISNAVENLQPENVKVIDTSGVVLSEGVLQRVRAGGGSSAIPGTEDSDNPELPQEAKTMLPQDAKEAYGQPIIPNFDKIEEWFDLKWEFEQKLARRVTKQLLGILPVGSFKVAVSTDLGPVEDGKIVDVRRMTISVVADSQNEDLFVDSDLKTRIFNTISSASGYVKGRDVIQFSRADFTLLAPEDLDEQKTLKRELDFQRLLFKYGYFLLPILGVAILGYVLYRFIRRFMSRSSKEVAVDEDTSETPFDDFKKDLNETKQLDRLTHISRREPQVLARVMEEWLNSVDDDVIASPAPSVSAPRSEEDDVDFGDDAVNFDSDEDFDDLAFDEEDKS